MAKHAFDLISEYHFLIEYEKILKCLLFLCILGFLNAWWPFEIRMWSSFRFICPVEKIRGRESIHNCEKHWKSICIFVLKTLAGWRERERYIGREVDTLLWKKKKDYQEKLHTESHYGLFWTKKLQNNSEFQVKGWVKTGPIILISYFVKLWQKKHTLTNLNKLSNLVWKGPLCKDRTAA